MHKISAVKHKGQSPTYTEQTKTKPAPPKASGDAPSGAPKNKTRRGGKGKAKVHAIVSALVPPSVTKCLQETHHAAAPVAAPVSVPIMASMTVGGPSCAPVWVPMTRLLVSRPGILLNSAFKSWQSLLLDACFIVLIGSVLILFNSILQVGCIVKGI